MAFFLEKLAPIFGSSGGALFVAVAAAGLACFIFVIIFSRPASRPLKKKWGSFKIIGKKTVSRSEVRPVVFFTIGATSANIPTGSHVRVRAPDPATGKMVERKYTPTRFDGRTCD